MIRAAGDQGGNGGGGTVGEVAAPSQPVQQTLTRLQLQPVVQPALADWQSAGATAAQLAQLRQVPVFIQALPASYLGEEGGNQVWISPTGINPGGVNMTTAADSSGPFGSLDTPSELGQTESLSVQTAMDQVTKVTDTLSNVLKNVADTGSALTPNLK